MIYNPGELKARVTYAFPKSWSASTGWTIPSNCKVNYVQLSYINPNQSSQTGMCQVEEVNTFKP